MGNPIRRTIVVERCCEPNLGQWWQRWRGIDLKDSLELTLTDLDEGEGGVRG